MRRETVIQVGLAICAIGVAMIALYGLAYVGAEMARAGAVIALLGAVIALLGVFKSDPPERAAVIPVGVTPRTRPRVRLRYSWRECDPKDKPFHFENSGDAEALAVTVPQFGDYGYACTFDVINHIAPNGRETVSSEPRVNGKIAPLFATHPDMLNSIVHERAETIRRANHDAARAPMADIQQALNEQVGGTNDGTLPIVVHYNDPSGRRHATEYELSFFWYAEIQEIDLRWIRDD